MKQEEHKVKTLTAAVPPAFSHTSLPKPNDPILDSFTSKREKKIR